MGVVLANLLLPLWNQTLWKQSNPSPVLHSWKQLMFLVLCEIVVGVMVWLDIPLLYYPVAILSTATVIIILGMVYSLLWSIILNKENTLEKLKEGWTFYLLGVICALPADRLDGPDTNEPDGILEWIPDLDKKRKHGNFKYIFSVWFVGQRRLKRLHPIIGGCSVGQVH